MIMSNYVSNISINEKYWEKTQCPTRLRIKFTTELENLEQ